jgi:hypothetical protein
MPIKAVIVFQQISGITVDGTLLDVNFPNIGYSSRSHIGGWTESLMWGTDVPVDVKNALQTGANGNPALLDARADLLASSASIVGYKLYQGGAGKGQSFAIGRPGNKQYNTDIPQMGLQMKSGGIATTSTRRWTLRGIPDLMVQNGEFVPTSTYDILLSNYMQALKNFGFNGLDPTQSKKVAVFKVDDAGNVTTKDGTNPFANNTIVRVSRVVSDLDGSFLSRTDLTQLPDAGTGAQFKLKGWDLGSGKGGTAYFSKQAFFAFDFGTMAANRIVTRRVGRPFEQYRGRRSKRRTKA